MYATAAAAAGPDAHHQYLSLPVKHETRSQLDLLNSATSSGLTAAMVADQKASPLLPGFPSYALHPSLADTACTSLAAYCHGQQPPHQQHQHHYQHYEQHHHQHHEQQQQQQAPIAAEPQDNYLRRRQRNNKSARASRERRRDSERLLAEAFAQLSEEVYSSLLSYYVLLRVRDLFPCRRMPGEAANAAAEIHQTLYYEGLCYGLRLWRRSRGLPMRVPLPWRGCYEDLSLWCDRSFIAYAATENLASPCVAAASPPCATFAQHPEVQHQQLQHQHQHQHQQNEDIKWSTDAA